MCLFGIETSLNSTSLDTIVLNPQSWHNFVTIHCVDCSKEFVVFQGCSDKTCPTCQKKRSWRNGGVVFAILQTLGLLNRSYRLKFVTLTIKNVSDVSMGYAKLRRCFGVLMRRAVWYKSSYGRGDKLKGWNVRGGCGNFETTNRMLGKGYHVHLHLLLECDFIPQKELSDLWLKITGDSKVVDVRVCSGTKDAIAEVTKYNVKPAVVVDWSGDMIMDFNSAMHNKVLFFRFGSWREVKYSFMQDRDCSSFVSFYRINGRHKAKCKFCGSLNVIVLEFECPSLDLPKPIIVYGADNYG